MKKYIFIIFILFFVALSSGCTNLQDNNETSRNSTYHITDKDSKTNHYDDNEISFDYPNTWNINVGNYSISLFNDKKQITIEKLGITTSYYIENSSKNVSSTVPPLKEVTSNKTIIVDGLKAQEITYKNTGDLEPSRMEIIINKNGKNFKIYFYAPPDEFNIAQTDFNVIINSLKIK